MSNILNLTTIKQFIITEHYKNLILKNHLAEDVALEDLTSELPENQFPRGTPIVTVHVKIKGKWYKRPHYDPDTHPYKALKSYLEAYNKYFPNNET